MTTKNEQLQKTTPGSAMARPSFVPQSAEGTEHITREDLRLPRLSIAQGLSPQVQMGDPKFIEGLSVGAMFNDLTQEVYGKGPFDFFIVRADPPRWVEFYPREDGGGVKDLEVPPDDPRTRFGRDEHGESIKPAATQFYDFVLALWPSRELIALSFKSSALKTARNLNGLVKLRNAPLYTGKYTVGTAMEKNAQGSWPTYVIRNAGWVESEEDLAYLKNLYDGLKDRKIVIDREPGDDSPTAEGEVVNKDEIPF